tara:strand:- start:533 stop:949 length:417 start_codon:yes stop_codon:yes gene_type:complete
MNKLFLTMALAFSTIVASAQFSVLTTVTENADSAWSVTEKIGIGYQVNEKLMIGATADGEDKYEILGRYELMNGIWGTCVYNYDSETKEVIDRLDVGIGYSWNVWRGLYVDPNFTMPLEEDEDGEREGKFNLSISYKF